MKTHLMLSDRTVKPWYSYGDIHVSGDGFLSDGTLLGQESLARHLSSRNTSKTVSALQSLNGFFAYIANTDGAAMLAVDRVRSIPLFYGIRNDEVYISDDAEYVRSGVGDTALDEVAKQEFLLTGYVTGQDTLFPNVKQVQAGELIRIAPDENGKPATISNRWYRFLHEEPVEWDETGLREKLHRETIAAHKRLIQYAGGRQIVIPLSGGYDSRLIATMLKKLGYENVIAFTYGVRGNKESEISKTIAQNLGIPWHFVEYSNERWRTWFESTERKDYYRMGSGWVSLAHTQDWPAVWELKERGVLDPDAVVVPGHGGTVVGGHTPTTKGDSGFNRLNELISLVRQKHYSLRPWPSDVQALTDWNLRIMNRAECGEISTPVGLADAFEKWEWQERQAKFIVNSVRVYDFWGFDWWMPLWDAEFMRFWQGVPLELRLNKRWYAGYVAEVYGEIAGVPVQDAGSTERSTKISGYHNWQKRLSDSVKKRDGLRFFAAQVLLQFRLRQVRNHPIATFGKFPADLLLDSLKAGIGLNGINAICLLSFLTSELNNDDGFNTNSYE